MTQRLSLIAVGLLCLLAVSGTAVGQSAGFTFSTTADGGSAGGEVTVTFTFENTADETATAIINVTSIPAGWDVAERTDDGGTWNAGDRKWLYTIVPPGSSVSPSLTLSVPADANGTYNVSAIASDGSETIQSNVTFAFGTASEPTTGTDTGDMTTDTETQTDATASPVTDATGGSGDGFGVAVTGVALLAAGAVVGLAGRSGGDGTTSTPTPTPEQQTPESVTESFYVALFADDDIEDANEMYHPESEADGVRAADFEDLGGLENVTASIASLEVAEEGRGEAEIHVEVEYTTDEGTSTATDHVFLRSMRGEWRLNEWAPERTRTES